MYVYKDCAFVGELLHSKEARFGLLQGKLSTCSGERRMYIAPLRVCLSTKISNFKIILSWELVPSSDDLKYDIR